MSIIKTTGGPYLYVPPSGPYGGEGEGEVTGTITDSGSAPAVGATVEITAQGLSTTSDASGNYFFNTVLPGSIQVDATYDGETGNNTGTLSWEGTVVIDVQTS